MPRRLNGDDGGDAAPEAFDGFAAADVAGLESWVAAASIRVFAVKQCAQADAQLKAALECLYRPGAL